MLCCYLRLCCLLSWSANINEKCSEQNPFSISMQDKFRLQYCRPTWYRGADREKTKIVPGPQANKGHGTDHRGASSNIFGFDHHVRIENTSFPQSFSTFFFTNLSQ